MLPVLWGFLIEMAKKSNPEKRLGGQKNPSREQGVPIARVDVERAGKGVEKKKEKGLNGGLRKPCPPLKRRNRRGRQPGTRGKKFPGIASTKKERVTVPYKLL